MSSINKIIFIVLLFLKLVEGQPVFDTSIVNDRIRFQNITTRDGLSNSVILAIVQDKHGFMWFATLDGLNRYDGYEFRVFKKNLHNHNSPSLNDVRKMIVANDGVLWMGGKGALFSFSPQQHMFTHYTSMNDKTISAICQDDTNTIWVAADHELYFFSHQQNDFVLFSSEAVKKSIHIQGMCPGNGCLWLATNEGLYTVDVKSKAFELYNSRNHNKLSHKFVTTVYRDRSDNIWVGTRRGLDIIYHQTGQLHHCHSAITDISSFCEDNMGNLWMGTWTNGLLRISQNKIYHYKPQVDDPYSLKTKAIYSLFVDREGLLWIGSRGRGIFVVNGKQQQFHHHYHIASEFPNCLRKDDTRCLYEDGHGNLWIGTDGGGLSKLDRQKNEWSHYTAPKFISHNLVLAVKEDKNKNLWIVMRTGVDVLDQQYNTFTHFTWQDICKKNLQLVYSGIHIDEHFVWIFSHQAGLFRYEYATKIWKNFTTIEGLQGNNVHSFHLDTLGRFWVWAGGSLHLFDKKTQMFRCYFSPEISGMKVDAMCEDSGILWMGSRIGLGRFVIREKTLDILTEEHGLSNNLVWGVLIDRQKQIWISTNNGLSKYDVVNDSFTKYYFNDGLQSNEFIPGAYFQNKHGEMFFGGTHGFNTFFPVEIQRNNFTFPVLLTSFALFNNPIDIINGSLLKQPIFVTSDLEMQYFQNTLSFEFSAMSFTAPQYSQYKYKLEGFDQEWHFTNYKRRYVTYTNLDPGKYRLVIQGSNGNGVWSDSEVQLTLRVLQPWWESTFFQIFVILLILTMVFVAIRLRIRFLEKRNAFLRQEVAKRTADLEAANRAKSDFLASMSHELRSPLNAVIGFSEIIQRNSQEDKTRNYAKIIGNSSEHLLDVINQVLELSRIEAEKETLNIESFDLEAMLESLREMFSLQANKKQLDLRFITKDIPSFVQSDKAKLRQIIINFLANAIKFTESGYVELAVTAAENFEDRCRLSFAIKDTGCGIAQQEFPQIFEAFAQTTSGKKIQEGSGLGMFISHSFVQMLGGNITVSSRVGHGTQFYFDIYVDVVQHAAADHHFSEQQIVGIETPRQILVVDDREHNRTILHNILQPLGFEIHEAADGSEAIAMCKSLDPCLILMDMRMPVMDGFTATKHIKKFDSNVIIVAVTASGFAAEKQAIWAAGCHDILLKPINSKRLLEVIQKHLKIQYVYENNQPHTEESCSLSVLTTEDRHRLREAAIEANVDEINDIIEKIPQKHRSLSETLKSFTNNFDYDKIIDLIDDTP